MAEGRVVGQKRNGIATLLFDNEARGNAISLSMAVQAAEILAGFRADRDIQLLIVAGAGERSFISGADISEFEASRSDAASAARYETITLRMYDAVRNFPKPTIAKIRGFCLGGGLALATACDLRFAAEDAVLSIPAARIGIAYRAQFVGWLCQIVGAAQAKEILITARQYSAEEAYIMGLVHRVAPLATFEAAFAAYCEVIASNAPLSTAASKFAVNAFANGWTKLDVECCTQYVERCASSADYQEGRRAFAENRKPLFVGK